MDQKILNRKKIANLFYKIIMIRLNYDFNEIGKTNNSYFQN